MVARAFGEKCLTQSRPSLKLCEIEIGYLSPELPLG